MELLYSNMPFLDLIKSTFRMDAYLYAQSSHEYTEIADDIDLRVSFFVFFVISRLWYHSNWFWGLPPLLTKSVYCLYWLNLFQIISVLWECPVLLSMSILAVIVYLACAVRLAIIIAVLGIICFVVYIIIKVLSSAGRFSAPPAQKVCIALGGCADAGDSFAEKLGQCYIGLQVKLVDSVYSYGLYLISRPHRREDGARGGSESGRNDHPDNHQIDRQNQRNHDRNHDRIYDPDYDPYSDPD